MTTAWRDEFARSHGYDLGAMAATLRELDAAAGVRVASGEPRRPSDVVSQGASTLPPRRPEPDEAVVRSR